jgi:hypothetical protein
MWIYGFLWIQLYTRYKDIYVNKFTSFVSAYLIRRCCDLYYYKIPDFVYFHSFVYLKSSDMYLETTDVSILTWDILEWRTKYEIIIRVVFIKNTDI